MQNIQHTIDGSLRRQDDWDNQVVAGALELYRSVLWRARLYRWWSVLTRRPRSLLRLNQAEAVGTVRGSYTVGICAVPIRQIRGSESRSDDFDADFLPRQTRTRGRWLSIATACLTGITMPPVELLQVRQLQTGKPIGPAWIQVALDSDLIVFRHNSLP